VHKLRYLGVTLAVVAGVVFSLTQVTPSFAALGNNNCSGSNPNCTPIVCALLGGTATTNGDGLGPTTAFACGLGGTRATSTGLGGAVVSTQSTGWANHSIATGIQVGGGGVIAASGSAPNGSEAVATFTTAVGDSAQAIAYHNGFNGEASSAAAASGGEAIANTNAYSGIVAGNLITGPAGNFACLGQASLLVYSGGHLGLCAAGVAIP
jgi:hypothetical protein